MVFVPVKPEIDRIASIYEAGARLAREAPGPAEARLRPGEVRFRWLGLGERFAHPVYLRLSAREKAVLVEVEPAYTAFYVAVAGVLAAGLGGVPVPAALTGLGARGAVVFDAGMAAKLTEEILDGAEAHLVASDLRDPAVGFVGYLYRSGPSFVILDEELDVEPLDLIVVWEENTGFGEAMASALLWLSNSLPAPEPVEDGGGDGEADG